MYKTTLSVEGMMCGMCEQHVREAVQNALAENHVEAKKITASRKDKELVVLAEHSIDEKLLRSAVEATGYETGLYRSEVYEEKGFFKRLFG